MDIFMAFKKEKKKNFDIKMQNTKHSQATSKGVKE
jgi:hypothetical protein